MPCHGQDVSVRVGFRGRAHFSGLVRCHSVWECAVCMQGISMERGKQLRHVLGVHRGARGGDYLQTLTIPHDQGDALKPMRQAVAKAWQKVVAGAPWKRLKTRLRIIGYSRGLEVTVGGSGWHPHLHIVWLTQRPLTKGDARELEQFVYDRWVKAITASGYRAPSRAHGSNLQHCRVADYIAKLGLADELAKPSFKAGRAGHRTPIQLLDDIRRANFANDADVALWEEYAAAMRGALQLTWSKLRAPGRGLVSLYKLFGVEERSDAQLSFEPGADESARTLYTFERTDWDRVVGPNPRLRVHILELAERSPPGALEELIVAAIDKAKGLEPVPFTIGDVDVQAVA